MAEIKTADINIDPLPCVVLNVRLPCPVIPNKREAPFRNREADASSGMISVRKVDEEMCRNE